MVFLANFLNFEAVYACHWFNGYQIIETQTDRMIKTRNGNDENPKQELETDEAELAGAHFLSFLQRMLVAHTA